MDSIDKLLAEVKTEHTEPKNTPPQANSNPVKLVLSTNKSDVLIDKLLSDVQADFSEAKTEYTQSKSRNNLPQIQLNSPTLKSDGFIDNLLSDVQADFLEKDAAEALRKQEELIQEKIRQEKLKAKQREALEKPAKEWLAKLDPLSSEGLWFETFAQGYPGKLPAAIDYLQTNS